MDRRRWRARAQKQQDTTAASRHGTAIPAQAATGGIDPTLFRTDPAQRMALTDEARETVRRLTRRSTRAGMLSPLEYNLTISHERKFIWFRVAKVGTRTILGHFAEHDVPLDVHHAMRMRYPTAAFEEYFKFAFVRNPVDRFVSAWRNKVVDHNYFEFDPATHERMQRIEEFARWTAEQDLSDLSKADHHLALQSRLIDLTQVDFLGRLEAFDDDFADVCRRIGVPPSPAKPRNQTRPRDAEPEPVSDELRTILADVYRQDFQIFGY